MLLLCGSDAPLLCLQVRRSHTDASTTDDGLCFVQSVLKDGAISGRASSSEMGHAAFTVLQACVIERGMGGIAWDIGEGPKFRQSRGLQPKAHNPWKCNRIASIENLSLDSLALKC